MPAQTQDPIHEPTQNASRCAPVDGRWPLPCVSSLLLALGCGLPAVVAAQTPARVVVLDVSGPGGARVRAQVVKELAQHDLEFVERERAQREAESLGADLATPDGRVQVARELSVTAFVGGEVERSGKRARATVRVFDASTGAEVAVHQVSGRAKGLHRRARRRLWDALGEAISRARAPEPEPEPEPEARAELEAETEAEAEAAAQPQAAAPPEQAPAIDGERPPALELQLALPLMLRAFGYHEALSPLRDQSIDPTPGGRLRLRWYPAAHFTSGFAAALGLELLGMMMWPVDVEREDDGAQFELTQLRWGAGLRARLGSGPTRAGASVGFVSHAIELADAVDGTDPGVPSVRYSALRAGVDGRLALSDSLGAALGAYYLFGLGFGELGETSWFPHVSGNGLELELTLGYVLSPQVELQLGFDYLRYAMTFDPRPDDPSVQQQGRAAGGALDQVGSGWLGVSFTL